MITIMEALDIILKTVERAAPAKVALEDALGLVLSEDIVSRDAIPPFDNSAMDGYAVRAGDIAGAVAEAPVTLQVVDDIKAGDVPAKEIQTGQAARIMTGAQMPVGADAVVKVEDTSLVTGEERTAFAGAGIPGDELVPVLINCPSRQGQNIRRSGEDVAVGEKVLRAGDVLEPAEIGLLASLGFPQVPVYPRTKIAVITTGDELLEVSQPLSPGKIRNSNAYSLSAQIKRAGAIPVRMGIAADTKEGVRGLFEEALSSCDIILTTGGVSVGKYDVVKDVLDEIGAETRFWKVAQKPGNPLGFWTINGKYIFGLPGNPVAAMVCFEEYVRPAARQIMGRKLLFRPSVQAVLKSDIKKRAGRVHFIRVNVEKENGGYFVSSTGPQGSGILKSMVLADGLAIAPAEADLIPAGEKITVHLITERENH
jgi:molybdopterin molybdotransferase